MAAVLLAGELPGAGGGGLVWAAAVAVAFARRDDSAPVAGDDGAVVLIEVGSGRARGPTMLAADGARELERQLREAGFEAAARGRIAWVRVEGGDDWLERLVAAVESCRRARAVIVCLAPAYLREALDDERLGAVGVLLRAELPRQRSLASLAARELLAGGLRTRIAVRAPGRVASRRALAGIDPGGEVSRRAGRLARGLLGAQGGQALPLVLGGLLALVACTLVLAAFGGAVTATSRVQRAADLAALSAARSMRDDFGHLFEPARSPGGRPNPAHLEKAVYLKRASAAAVDAARRNGVDRARLRVEFPDSRSFAPLRVRAEVTAELEVDGALPGLPVDAEAEAEAVPPSPDASATAPAIASGGGYSGPLESRQGEGMRPDVAAAFDRMAAAAARDGIALLINSAYRSDAEQAALFAEHPDPRWVAPPGTSLHRCATELDLGPPTAYAWLAANARSFGFVQRYDWEAWHYGFVDGPAPCSAAGDDVGDAASANGAADGDSAAASLPAYVPARFRGALAAAGGRWNVSPALLAAQLMAESNFNPFAVSPAGAAGIAQFMPGTAAMYGLDDPFDAEAAIDAQAHLMADLLRQFGSAELALAAYNAGPAPVAACGCVPAIPETQAYVARMVGLMDGAGTIAAAPVLEVRLVD